MTLVIKRSDGQFYAGAAQKAAIWTATRERAAPFRDRAAADVRLSGLKKAEQENRTFEIEEA